MDHTMSTSDSQQTNHTQSAAAGSRTDSKTANPELAALFTQAEPQLSVCFESDVQLQDLLKVHLSSSQWDEFSPALTELGQRSGAELYREQLADRLNEPRLTQWDAWGQRIDHIELTPVWQKAAGIAAEYGVVAHGYEDEHGPAARLHQFAMAYLFIPSTDLFGCPLAMTDGAATTLKHSGNQELMQRALPHLLSRDPQQFWTSGQWMTETTGGSDVSKTETIARQDDNGQWRLYGRKWFTSAAASEMTLTLARPEGAPAGSKGLALFYLEPHDEQGRLNHIEVLRLKDKLGTRKLPTAELMRGGFKRGFGMLRWRGLCGRYRATHLAARCPGVAHLGRHHQCVVDGFTPRVGETRRLTATARDLGTRWRRESRITGRVSYCRALATRQRRSSTPGRCTPSRSATGVDFTSTRITITSPRKPNACRILFGPSPPAKKRASGYTTGQFSPRPTSIE